ncbi:MAG: hypothetical protein H6Q73_536 [Firmicutes bacterium]|nr:hypothetical protein [Bacillota bacterium]
MDNEDLILNKLLKEIQNTLQGIQNEIQVIKNQGLKADILEMKNQLRENTDLTKKLAQRTDELYVKIDGLFHNAITKDTLIETENHLAQRIGRVSRDITYLVHKAADHDEDIIELRTAK